MLIIQSMFYEPFWTKVFNLSFFSLSTEGENGRKWVSVAFFLLFVILNTLSISLTCSKVLIEAGEIFISKNKQRNKGRTILFLRGERDWRFRKKSSCNIHSRKNFYKESGQTKEFQYWEKKYIALHFYKKKFLACSPGWKKEFFLEPNLPTPDSSICLQLWAYNLYFVENTVNISFTSQPSLLFFFSVLRSTFRTTLPSKLLVSTTREL